MTSTFLGFLLLVVSISSPSTLERGDQEFARIRYPLAEDFYDSALNTSTDSADVLWRLARVYVCMADVAPQDQMLDLYRQAKAFACRCIQGDSMKSEGHTLRAAALGNTAIVRGR